MRLLAALTWDPQIRGAAIVLAGIVMLPGSVYLLLATNMGAKLGFVLALTGLAGWMTVMGAVWMVFGIGLKGPSPEWKVQEAFEGPVSQSLLPVVDGFPSGWTELVVGDAELADAQAKADELLAPSAAPVGAHGAAEAKEPSAAEERFDSPFSSTSDYVLLHGYKHGGENYFFSLRHRPHYVMIQVKPALFEESPAGFKAQPDLTAETTTVVMIRDLGHLRLPPFLVMFTSGIIFGVCCWNLHARDKEIMKAKAAAAAS